jgi:hypothetical protein
VFCASAIFFLQWRVTPTQKHVTRAHCIPYFHPASTLENSSGFAKRGGLRRCRGMPALLLPPPLAQQQQQQQQQREAAEAEAAAAAAAAAKLKETGLQRLRWRSRRNGKKWQIRP